MQAMTLMLTGKTIDARKAKSLGLVDAVAEERHVRNAVKDAVFGRLKRAKPGLLNWILNLGPVRSLLAKRMRAEAEKAAPHENYPAPYALIDLWEAAWRRQARDAAGRKTFVRETDGDADGAEPDPGLFPARADEEARRQSAARSSMSTSSAPARWAAISRPGAPARVLRVTLADMKPEPIAGAIKRASDLFGKILRKRTDIRDALDRLMPDLDGEGVRSADLIIEAVPEKLELKQKVYAALEPRMKPGAILATNTSSIPLQDLRTTLAKARAAGRPALLQSGVAAATGRGRQP